LDGGFTHPWGVLKKVGQPWFRKTIAGGETKITEQKRESKETESKGGCKNSNLKKKIHKPPPRKKLAHGKNQAKKKQKPANKADSKKQQRKSQNTYPREVIATKKSKV